MGDFNPQMDDKVSPEFNELPAWPEYSLPSSAILSIFAVIFIFFNTLLGGISTAVSIILYAVGSYYLYAKAMHVKSAQLDIELHKTYLAKIFTYMKTAFVFWSLNLSYILALIAQSVLTRVILWFRPSIESDPQELKNFMDTTLIASIVLFFVALITLIVLLPTPSTDSSIIIYPLSNREWIVIIIACLSKILYWICSSRKPIVKEVK